MVAGQRQLVSAAGTGTAHGGNIFLPGIGLSGLHGVSRFIGEFAEIHLVGMFSARQHPDIGAGAEDALFPRRKNDDTHLRMFKTHSLDDVGKFDVDAEIIGVEFQFVSVEQPTRLVNIHHHAGHVAFIGHAPVTIARRLGLEFDHVGHRRPPAIGHCDPTRKRKSKN